MGGQVLCSGDGYTTEDFIIPYDTIKDLTAEISAYRDGLASISTKASSVNIEYLRSESGLTYSYQYYRIIDITKSAVLVL